MGAAVFWAMVGVSALSVIWSSHLNRREIERTVRLAIESGLVLDAEMVRRLKGKSERSPAHMIIGGAVLLALALGVSIFAFAASVEDTDALLPVLGVAAILALPGAALIAGGLWLRSQILSAPKPER